MRLIAILILSISSGCYGQSSVTATFGYELQEGYLKGAEPRIHWSADLVYRTPFVKNKKWLLNAGIGYSQNNWENRSTPDFTTPLDSSLNHWSVRGVHHVQSYEDWLRLNLGARYQFLRSDKWILSAGLDLVAVSRLNYRMVFLEQSVFWENGYFRPGNEVSQVVIRYDSHSFVHSAVAFDAQFRLSKKWSVFGSVRQFISIIYREALTTQFNLGIQYDW